MFLQAAQQTRRPRAAADGDDRRVPLMGVLGAFVFAAQMVNFAIPGTGSSGHLGGGLLLAILLGPRAAFIVIASVLIVQALFFADGGLLALGCNVFNLGFFPAFVASTVGWLRRAPAASARHSRPSPRLSSGCSWGRWRSSPKRSPRACRRCRRRRSCC